MERSAQIPRKFPESFFFPNMGLQNKRGRLWPEWLCKWKPVLWRKKEHHCETLLQNCPTRIMTFEWQLFKKCVVDLTSTNIHISPSCIKHMSAFFFFFLTALWRGAAVRRCSIRPAALPTAGARHWPARHVHRCWPADQPRQRLPVLLHLHHDMLLPASRNCRPHLFNPSEFNYREGGPLWGHRCGNPLSIETILYRFCGRVGVVWLPFPPRQIRDNGRSGTSFPASFTEVPLKLEPCIMWLEQEGISPHNEITGTQQWRKVFPGLFLCTKRWHLKRFNPPLSIAIKIKAHFYIVIWPNQFVFMWCKRKTHLQNGNVSVMSEGALHNPIVEEKKKKNQC